MSSDPKSVANMESTCIICLNTWESSSSSTTNVMSRFEKELQVNHNKFLLQSFCRHFNIPLQDSTMDWNFHNEDLPFCSSCQETTKNLIDLVQQLQSVRNAVTRVENSVKNGIVLSSGVVDGNEDQDQRVKILRDLIVGPNLCLVKLPDGQTANAKENIKIKKSAHIKKKKRISRQTKLNSSNHRIKINSDVLVDVKIENFEEIPDCDDPSVLISSADVEVFVNYDDDNSRDDDGHEFGDDNNLETDVEENVSSADEAQIKKHGKKRKRTTLRKNNQIKKQQQPHLNKPVRKVARVVTKSDKNVRKSQKVDDTEVRDTLGDLDFTDQDVGSRTDSTNNIIVEDCESDKPSKGNSRRKILQVAGEESKFIFCDFEFHGTQQEGFRCCLCPDKVYNRKYDVVMHIRWSHLNEEKKCLCDTCGKRFHKESELRRHVKTHGQNARQPVICTICGGAYKDKDLLARHVLTMHEHGNTALCQYCSMLFFSEHKLARHIEQFHADLTGQQVPMSIFRCEHCDCTFIQRASLTRHMRRYHKDVLAAEAVIPDKIRHEGQIAAFWQPSTAAAPTVINPYPCPGCNLTFSSPLDLAEHVKEGHKLTDGEVGILEMAKIYRCEICNMAYQSLGSLRKHERTVHNFPAKKSWNRRDITT